MANFASYFYSLKLNKTAFTRYKRLKKNGLDTSNRLEEILFKSRQKVIKDVF